MRLLINAIILTILVTSTPVHSNTLTNSTSVRATPKVKPIPSSNSTGYDVLKTLLEDEQYLTSIRRTKMILTFGDISDSSSKLIDEISSSSEQAITELEKLADENPFIEFNKLQDSALAKATLDSLRMTTAKEFLFESDDFEKNILISQLKVLRLISHLAVQIEEIEPNTKRKAWLSDLSTQFEKYYKRVNSRITLQASK